jgi:alkanesulfonate monooxygenase SsuD/methylene tetrahydromethanopterin reductase-like flavin-dependent oxidoreductase (luciferase family)
MISARSARIGVSVPVPGLALPESLAAIDFLAGCGFSTVTSTEVNAYDGFSVLAAVAARCPQLELGTGVVSVFNRSVPLLAMSAAAVADLSDEAVLVGLGVGSRVHSTRWHGAHYAHPGLMLRETIACLREIATGRPVEFHGELVKVDGFQLAGGARPIRVGVGGMGPRSVALAGAEADALVLNMVPRSMVGVLVQQLRDSARAAGRDEQAVEVVLRVWLSVGELSTGVRDVLTRHVARYVRAPGYSRLVSAAGYRLDQGAAGAPLDGKLFDDVVVVGSREQCVERLVGLIRSGVDTLVISPVVADEDASALELVMGTIPLIADDVLKAVAP